jgi:hypothetical protein
MNKQALNSQVRTLMGHDGRLPNYVGDLNACLKMEETLKDRMFFRYYATLAQICMDEGYPHFASATALQRCKAFVLTHRRTSEEATESHCVASGGQ